MIAEKTTIEKIDDKSYTDWQITGELDIVFCHEKI